MITLDEDSRVKFITRIAQEHDRDLFAIRGRSGAIMIMRKARRAELVFSDNGHKMFNIKDAKQFVFALTDNWTASGTPRHWGGEVVLRRLKAHDSQQNEKILEKLEAEEKSVEEGRKKDLRNKTENWLAEKHSTFKKAFGDVLTHSMDKTEIRRRAEDKNQTIKGA